MDKLTDEQIQSQLANFPKWTENGGQIVRTFQFEDFLQAIRFVNEVAEAAEAAQHHPDILIRYNKVTLTLTTHDAGGITLKDFDLARKANAFAGALVA